MTVEIAQPWPPVRCEDCDAVVESLDGRYLCPCGWALTAEGGIAAWSTLAPIGSSYPAHAARAQAEWEVKHFWPRGRALILGDVVYALVRPEEPNRPARFLEVGCGTGTVLAQIASRGFDATGCDAFRSNLEIARERVPAAALFQGDGATATAPGWFDAVGLFDVIEHVDDEVPILASCLDVVRPTGRLFVTVPAFQGLYGRRDRIAGHRRRYRAATLRARIEAAGWRVERITYFSTVLFPLFVLARFVERLVGTNGPDPTSGTDLAETKAGGALNGLGLVTFALERRWLRRHSLPFGSSLLAVARRP